MKAKKILIVLLALDGTMEDTLYCLNSILFQDYPDLALLITGEHHSNFSMQKLYQTLSANKKDNLKSIWIKLFDEDLFLDKSKKYVFEYAKANGYDYLCCLRDIDAFYQNDSLSLLMCHWQVSDDMLCANTIIYDWNDTYCDELERHLSEIEEEEGIEAYFSKTNVLLAEKPNWQDELVSAGVLYLEKYNLHKQNISPRFIRDIPLLKSRKQVPYEKINYTAFYIGKRYADILKARTFTEDEIDRIKKWIRMLVKNKSSKWNRCISDVNLCEILTELLAVNQKESGEQKLETLLAAYGGKAVRKIKIVFFCQKYSTFPSLKSVYERAASDARFETRLVYVPFSHVHQQHQAEDRGIQDYIMAGYPVIAWKYYDLAKDSPDLAVFVSPYDEVPEGFSVEEVSKVVRRCIYIPYGMTMESDNDELVRLRYRLPMNYFSWMEICDDEFDMHLAEQYLYHEGKGFAPLGSPRMDFIKMIPLKSDIEYIKEIRMAAADRKVVLWNTHHSVGSSSKVFSSWEKYGAHILSYFKRRDDLFLLWRPHPFFFDAVKEQYGKGKAEMIIADVEKCRNIKLDQYHSYSAGFSAADLFLSDQSSLVKEFLFTGKPVIITAEQPEDILNVQIRDCCYVPQNEKELFELIDILVKGEDSKNLLREKYIRQYRVDDTMSIAEKILDHMYDKLHQELDQCDLFPY